MTLDTILWSPNVYTYVNIYPHKCIYPHTCEYAYTYIHTIHSNTWEKGEVRCGCWYSQIPTTWSDLVCLCEDKYRARRRLHSQKLYTFRPFDQSSFSHLLLSITASSHFHLPQSAVLLSCKVRVVNKLESLAGSNLSPRCYSNIPRRTWVQIQLFTYS